MPNAAPQYFVLGVLDVACDGVPLDQPLTVEVTGGNGVQVIFNALDGGDMIDPDTGALTKTLSVTSNKGQASASYKTGNVPKESVQKQRVEVIINNRYPYSPSVAMFLLNVTGC